ncbi:MAG: ABC transporter transmembrane domain-containing protein [Bacteroidota bacterium]
MANGRPGSAPVEEKDKKKVTKAGLKQALRVFSFVKPYRLRFFTGLIFLAFSSLTTMAFPYVTGKLVDSATGVANKVSRNDIALSLIGILMLQAAFSFIRVAIFATVSENTMRDIRTALYSRILCLPVPYLEQRRVGELTSRLTSDISQLQDVLSFTLAEFFRQFATLIIGIVFICYISPQLTLVMLSSFPLIVGGALVFGRFIRKLSKKVQDELAEANIIAEETLQAINVVKAFTNELFEIQRYRTALNKVLKNALHTASYRGAFISFVIFAIFGGIVLVMWYGLGLVANKEITIGGLVSFIVYTSFIGAAVGGLGDLYGQLQRTIGASERIVEILDETPEVDYTQPAPLFKRMAGDVRFSKVQFSYPSRLDVTVLHEVSLHIEPGQKVALVGQSGAGKTTLASLLLRNYPITGGSISIDGENIQNYNITQLRANVGVVPQEVMLFGGSIRENIAYGKPGASDAEVEEAAKKANALQFIKGFPEGMNTLVGERGIKLSGGQRQRIAIARAVLKDPAILILDEATSSLDSESEMLVQQALDELMKGRTTIIIAHRLATIRNADYICVLNEGRIGEQGTHKELMDKESGIYANLIKLQFNVA